MGTRMMTMMMTMAVKVTTARPMLMGYVIIMPKATQAVNLSCRNEFYTLALNRFDQMCVCSVL